MFSAPTKSARGAGTDQGFTLIELLVVLLIIGILLAIAIPTFLGITRSAGNVVAESNVTTAFTVGETFAISSPRGWWGLTPAVFNALGTGLDDVGSGYAGHQSRSASQVSFEPTMGGNGALFVVRSSSSGWCYGVVIMNSATESFTPETVAPSNVATLGVPIRGPAVVHFIATGNPTKSPASSATCTAADYVSPNSGFSIPTNRPVAAVPSSSGWPVP